MSKRKLFILITAILTVATLAVGVTAAYMTDSEEKINTFTVGNLDITLSEPGWDDTVSGKNMVPGYTAQKDPTVTAVDGDSYMRITVEFVSADDNEMTAERIEKIMQTVNYNDAVGINKSNFTKDTSRSSELKHVYKYNGEFSEGETAKLFNSVKIPSEWNQSDLEQLGAYKLVIRAEAIQSYGFESAEDAYDALDSEIEAGTVQEDYKTVNGGI